jgi:antitoxin component YwqK of YwqJK toxin-antitoxin module
VSLFRKISLAFVLLLGSCHKSTTDDSLVLIQIQDRNGLSETISNPDRLVSYEKVDFLTTQPYKKVLRVYRKEGKNHSVITTYHPNGMTWQMLEAKEMRAFGSFQEWFASGAKKIEATVIGGSADLTPGAQDSWLFDGTSTVYNEDGRVSASILYDKGVLSGLSTYYYPSGAVLREIPYVQDHIDGDLKEFWEEGQLKTRSAYLAGLKDGTSTSWWPDGSILSEEQYDRGLLKMGSYWNPQKESVCEVVDGAGFRAVFDVKRLQSLQEIRGGFVEGIVKNFDDAGDLRCIYHVKNGKKQGEEIEYFPKAAPTSPKMSIDWDQDAIHGIVKTWYPNGQMQSQTEMCRNKRSGASCCWYLDGSLMMMEEYENDELSRGQYFKKGQHEPVSTITHGTGTASIFDENGVFLRKINYSKGKLVETD